MRKVCAASRRRGRARLLPRRTNRDGDRPPRRPANHADLDLAVTSEAISESVLGTFHSDRHLIRALTNLVGLLAPGAAHDFLLW